MSAVRVFQVVRCLGCGFVWDEQDPNSKVCDCIDRLGGRIVSVISEGATNTPRFWHPPNGAEGMEGG